MYISHTNIFENDLIDLLVKNAIHLSSVFELISDVK